MRDRLRLQSASWEMHPGPSARSSGPQHHDAIRDKARDLIHAVYEAHNPEKVTDIESLLERYRGSEKYLYERICETY